MKWLMLISLLLVGLVQSPPCATVDVTLGQDPIATGQTQEIDTVVTNCGDKKIKLGVTVTITDAVGTTTLLRNTIQNYNPGQSVAFEDLYPIPATGPTGTWRVIAIVHDNSPQGGSAELARDPVEFQVTN